MPITLNGTTGIQNVLGSASAPADTNTTTPTTGVYYPSATTWGVSTAGTNALYIDASQKVGIGTTSPAELLEVNKASASFTVMKATNTNGYGKFGVRDTGPAYIESASSQGIGFYVNGGGTTAAFMDSSGNVGIGTSSPSTYTASKLVSYAATGDVWNSTDAVAATAGSGFHFYNNGTLRGEINTGGSSFSAWGGANSFNILGFANAPMTFATNSAERMRIDSSGNLLVGTTTANGKFSLVQAANGAVLYVQNSLSSGFTGPMIFSNSVSAASTNWYHLYGVSSGNTVLNIAIYGNGNIVNANNSYGAISDVSLKENIVDATPKLSDLMQVKIRNYNLKSDEDKTKQIGVVAQELETVFPAMIETNKDGIKGVKYSVFVPMLIKAIQELKAEFDAYKAAHP